MFKRHEGRLSTGFTVECFALNRINFGSELGAAHERFGPEVCRREFVLMVFETLQQNVVFKKLSLNHGRKPD